MPDTVVTETPQSTSNPYAPTSVAEGSTPTTERGTDQDAARRALYEKHYGTPGGTQTDVSAVPDSASTAQVDQTSVTTETTKSDQPPAYFVEAYNALKQELDALRAAANKPPVTSTSTEAPPMEAPWVTALRKGDVVAAEQAMADAVAKRVQEQLKQPLQETETRTIERMQAMNEIESFVKDLRTSNAELSDMESFIALDAQQRLAQVQASGSIKTTGDAVREYKKAVLEATDNARKVAQKLRGSGKTEAMTRNREVLSASTLPPSGVDTSRAPVDSQEKAPESMDDYFSRRRAAETSRRGLAV